MVVSRSWWDRNLTASAQVHGWQLPIDISVFLGSIICMWSRK